MVVLLTGATGFIGRHLAAALLARGHELVCAVRNAGAFRPPPGVRMRCVEVSFGRDFDSAVWVPRLAGVDAVVNAVGILRESAGARFEALHVRTPIALFAACAAAGVRRVVQISALGADAGARSRYHLTKKQADDYLAASALDWHIVQPSLVYGPGGASAQLFDALASLPLVPLPGGGEQRVQPIHIGDAVEAIVRLLEARAPARERIALVGPEPLSMRELLGRLRAVLGLGPARFLPVPLGLVRTGARLGRLVPTALFDEETLGMLLRGNTADPAATTRLLGRSPRPVEAFVAPAEARARAQAGKLAWLLPLLRWSVALVWIVTGLVSLGLYPVERSYELLARTGITGALAPVALYGAAALDLAFGIAILTLRRRRLLWLAQIVVILAYTLIITVALPEYWLHPYGPVLKNVPLLAAIWLLYELEPR